MKILLMTIEKLTGAGYVHIGMDHFAKVDDEIRKYVIMRLMCDLLLDLTEVGEKFQIRFEEYFKDSIEKLQPLLKDELIVQSGRTLIIPMQGRLFLRNIAICFDAYLPKFQKDKFSFSRTV